MQLCANKFDGDYCGYDTYQDCFGNERCDSCDDPCPGCDDNWHFDECEGGCGGVATVDGFCEGGCAED